MTQPVLLTIAVVSSCWPAVLLLLRRPLLAALGYEMPARSSAAPGA